MSPPAPTAHRPAPGVLGVHHVALRTRNVPGLSRFYREVLGLRELRRARDGRGVRSIWLAAGATLLMIERAAAGEPAPPRRSMELVALGIDVSARDAFRAHLRRRRVAIEAETEFTLYLRDPEGRRLALSHHPHRGLDRGAPRDYVFPVAAAQTIARAALRGGRGRKVRAPQGRMPGNPR